MHVFSVGIGFVSSKQAPHLVQVVTIPGIAPGLPGKPYPPIRVAAERRLAGHEPGLLPLRFISLPDSFSGASSARSRWVSARASACVARTACQVLIAAPMISAATTRAAVVRTALFRRAKL